MRDPHKHTSQRKSLAHAFSSKALMQQHGIVTEHISAFTKKVGELSRERGSVDLTEAYNWLTFDIIGTQCCRLDPAGPVNALTRSRLGHLAFGEPFGAVEQAQNNYWISTIVDGTFLGSLTSVCRRVPILYAMLPLVAPPNAKTQHEEKTRLTREKMEKRMELGSKLDQDDFFGHILTKKEYAGLAELESQANTLIVAGSETTSTFMAGVTYYLLKSPSAAQRLTAEVRSAFSTAAEIDGTSTKDLPYLGAVIEEGLRMFPPAPFGLARVCPGAYIDGHFVPPGTVVGTDDWSTAHSERYWHRASEFLPERWLDQDAGGAKEFANDDRSASRPFSLGPRACLGVNLAWLEMRMILAQLFYTWDLTMLEPGMDWVEESQLHLLWKKPALRVRVDPAKRSEGTA